VTLGSRGEGGHGEPRGRPFAWSALPTEPHPGLDSAGGAQAGAERSMAEFPMQSMRVRLLWIAILPAMCRSMCPYAAAWASRLNSITRQHVSMLSDGASELDPSLHDEAPSITAAFSVLVNDEANKKVAAAMEAVDARARLVNRYRAELAAAAAGSGAAKILCAEGTSQPLGMSQSVAAAADAKHVGNSTTRRRQRGRPPPGYVPGSSKCGLVFFGPDGEAKRHSKRRTLQRVFSNHTDGASITATFAAQVNEEADKEAAAAAIEAADARARLVDRYRAELATAAAGSGAAEIELRAEGISQPLGTTHPLRAPAAVAAWAKHVSNLITRQHVRVKLQSDGASITAAFAAQVNEEAAKEAAAAAIEAADARARLAARLGLCRAALASRVGAGVGRPGYNRRV
jgi:hypothetical protein